MNCESCQERLAEFLLGELDAPSADAVGQHLQSGCASCNHQRDVIADSIDLLVRGVDLSVAETDGDAKNRVWQEIRRKLDRPSVGNVASIDTERDSAGEFAGLPPASQWIRRSLVAAVAIACGFVVATLSMNFVNMPENGGAVDQNIAQVAPESSETGVQVVSLRPKKESSIKSGTVVFDAAASQVHFYSAGLSTPQSGEYYAFWFVTVDQEWILGGKLTVKDGVAGQVFDLPKSGRPVLFAAVTRQSDASPAGTHGTVALVSDDVRQPAAMSIP